ncbi:uncharacterized protein LOC116853610, partial [Odontomachus brunneus]|uniref:uncharacterized protein LOC116853610 n=1 Tax=Odontomachus brunneus TaxID=486640 RepID=UPI0013F1AE16
MKRRAKSPLESNDDLIAPFLPMKTVEGIKEFDIVLKTSDEAVTQFKQFLSKSGGNNGKDNIHRCLKKILTNECAMKCSWKGLRNNFIISNLYFIRIMKGEIILRYSIFTECEFD